MRTIGLAALATTALAAACSPLQDTKAADAQIATFHQKLNAQDFAGIYAASGPELRATATEDALAQLLTAVHSSYGAFQSGSDTGWNDHVDTQGHMMTITYAARYEHGAAEERFVYRIKDGQAQLAGYHIKAASSGS